MTKYRGGFRDKYLALLMITILTSLGASAQWTRPNTSYGTRQYRIGIDSALMWPTGCGAPSRLQAVDIHQFAIYGDSCNNTVYYYNPKTLTWYAFGSGGGGTRVDSLTLVDSVLCAWQGGVSVCANLRDDSVLVKDDLTVTRNAQGKQVLGHLHADGVVSGGILTSSACLTTQLGPTGYYLKDGTLFLTALTSFTVTPDATLPITFGIILDTNGTASLRSGTPSLSPQRPSYNPASEWLLTTFTVAGGATCLDINNIVIYDETGGSEYDTLTNGAITSNGIDVANPQHLTKAYFISKYADGAKLILDKPSGQDTVFDNSVFAGWIWLNNSYAGKQLQMQLFRTGAPVSNNIVVNVAPLDTAHYQLLAEPRFAFGGSGNIIYDSIVYTLRGNDLSGASGFYFDYLRLQTGLTNTTLGRGVISIVKNAAGDTTITTLQDGTVIRVFDRGGTATGTVTSISQGYGITNTPNPIVSTGTIAADSATLSNYYLRRKDSVLYTTIYQNSLKLASSDTTNKWVQNAGSNAGGDSLIVTKNGVRTAYKYPAGGGSVDTTNFSHFIAPYKVKLYGTVNWEGTSITLGNGASIPALTFVNEVTATTLTTANNTAVGASSVKNTIFRRFTNAETINTSQPLGLEIGINDVKESASLSRKWKIVEGIKTIVVNQWLDTFIPIDSAIITQSGTWASLVTANISSKSVIKSRGVPIKSSTAPSKLNFNHVGSNLVIGTWGVDSSHTGYGTFSVKIDGVLVTTYDMKGKADDWFYAPNGTLDERMPTAILITGLSSGRHAVEIEVLENKEVDFDYIGRLAQPANAKPVILINVARAKVSQVTVAQISYIDSVNKKIDSLGRYFRDLGYPIAVAKTPNYFDTTNTSDGLHPNDLGHRQFANAVLSVIDSVNIASPGTLTLSTGLTGSSYNGSANVTTRVDTGRTAQQIFTGGSAKKVIDSLAALLSTKLSSVTAATATNTIDNLNFKQIWNWSTIAGDTAFSFNSNSINAGTNLQTVLAVTQSGANTTTTQTTYSAKFSNTKTGTLNSNVAVHLNATGGINNYALIVQNGFIGSGTATPLYALHIANGAFFSSGDAGGISYWLPNSGIIRGVAGASNIYLDGNTAAGGIINFRSTSIIATGDMTVKSVLTTGVSGFNTSGVSTTGYNIMSQNIAQTSADTTVLRLNDNATLTKVGLRALMMQIKDNASSPNVFNYNNAAIFELNSTTRAFLFPRMTTAQRNAIVLSGVVIGTIAGGSLYTNGIYVVSLTGGTGTGATASITVTSGGVVTVRIIAPGTGYVVGDVLSATLPVGSGFTYTLTGITGVPGLTIFCTDCTATDASTGVTQTLNAAGAWKNAW